MIEKTVLVLEDEEVVQRLCGRVLSRIARRVRIVATVREAIRAIETEPPDLLVSDLRLPDGDGVDAVLALKARSPEARVIVVSGSLTPEKRFERLKGLDLVAFLAKPFEVDALQEAALRALGGAS